MIPTQTKPSTVTALALPLFLEDRSVGTKSVAAAIRFQMVRGVEMGEWEREYEV